MVSILNDLAINSIYPDLTFILDVDVAESLKRRASKLKDRMEQVDNLFIEKVKNGYLEIAEKNKKRCFVLDCNDRKIKSINLELEKIINEKYKGILK